MTEIGEKAGGADAPDTRREPTFCWTFLQAPRGWFTVQTSLPGSQEGSPWSSSSSSSRAEVTVSGSSRDSIELSIWS